MEIPRPKSWDEFQDITRTALKIRWRSPNLQQNGRLGQAQAGVDIWGPDDLGRQVGVQCKLTRDELSISEIETEVMKADSFVPPLNAFFVATSGNRDVKLQLAVRILSEARVGAGKFPVGVFFWDDLIQDLATSPADFAAHYPQLKISAESGRVIDLLCVLDVAYLGHNVQHCMDLIFGEFGRMANENPAQFGSRLRSLVACARPLMQEAEHVELARLADSLANSARDGRWDDAEYEAKQLEGIVESLEYRFLGKARSSFTLGRALNRWDSLTSKEGPIRELGETILVASRALYDDALANKLDALIGQYNASDAIGNVHLPNRAYNEVRRRLLREPIV